MKKLVSFFLTILLFSAFIYTARADNQSINVEYNKVSPSYTIGEGTKMGFILFLPDGHGDMDIQIGSEKGDLELIFYGYNGNILWESGKELGFLGGYIAVKSGNVNSFYCGSDVYYILVYHPSEYEDYHSVNSATFWYQGAIERTRVFPDGNSGGGGGGSGW